VKSIIKANTYFFTPYFIFLLSGGVLLLLNGKAHTHLEFNSFHNAVFDAVFYYITYLGDGILALLITIILASNSFRYAFIVGASNLLASATTQILKHYVFIDAVRPKKYFEGVANLYLVPGVDNYLYNSFPSGHSTCAFALYLALALITKNKSLKFIFFTIAALVAYSRIYLSQHFLDDVYAGSLIGVVFTLSVFYFVQKWNAPFLNKSITSLVSKQ
jgi:membrane-associated phospholipid phosphatase